MGRDGFVKKGGHICFESLGFSKNRAQDSLERENKKRKLVEEMIKEKQDKQKRKSTRLSKFKCKFI